MSSGPGCFLAFTALICVSLFGLLLGPSLCDAAQPRQGTTDPHYASGEPTAAQLLRRPVGRRTPTGPGLGAHSDTRGRFYLGGRTYRRPAPGRYPGWRPRRLPSCRRTPWPYEAPAADSDGSAKAFNVAYALRLQGIPQQLAGGISQDQDDQRPPSVPGRRPAWVASPSC